MTTRTYVTALAAICAVPLTVGGIFADDMRQRIDPGGAERLLAPDNWVPFRATFTITHPGQPSVVGRFFRADDGSERTESGPSFEDVRIIAIRNVADEQYYSRRGGRWTREPWTAPNGGQPPQMPESPSITPHPYKLAIMKGQSGASDASVGFVAYAVSTGTNTLLQVPKLNWFAAIRQRRDGRYESYTNVEFVYPEPELFRPPPSEPIFDEAPPLAR